MKITIYGRDSCAPCRMLKTYLNRKNISFINRDVDKDPEAAAEAYAYSGLSTVPVTVVENNGERKIISGYNLQSLIPAIS